MTRHVLLSLLLAGIAAAQNSGAVTAGGQPVPGATVTARQGETTVVAWTDENGRYVLDRLGSGTWVVEVEMFGFTPARREVTGGAAGEANFSLELRPLARRAAPPARSSAGFQVVNVNPSAESEVTAALAAAHTQPGPATQENLADANESFLVTGSLSRGLETARQEDMFAMRMGGPGPGMGPGAPGMPGGPGMEGMGGAAGPGQGGGPQAGGPGGFGGPGGGGFGGMGGRGGGPGVMGGRGGFGGMGGRGGGGPGRPGAEGGRRPGGPGGAPPFIDRPFGNRAGRGREGFRGAVFFTMRNSALDARPFSLTGQTVDKAAYAQNRFGVTLGGALHIPKIVDSPRTFIFLNYSGSRSRNPFNAVATLPTPEERAGDFALSATKLGSVAIYDPLSRLPFTGNRVPASRFHPAAKGLLEFIPAPNQPGQVQNYQFVTSSRQSSDNLGLRVQQSLARRDRLSANVNIQTNDGLSPQLYGFLDSTNGRGISADLGWSHTLAARIINNLRLNFNRNRNDALPYFANRRDVAGELGIQGPSRDPLDYGPPNLSFTNFGGLTDGSPSRRRNQTFGVNNSILIFRGKHNISAGVDVRRTQNNSGSHQNARGSFTFSGLATSALDAQGLPVANTGYDFADFLLGLPQSSSIRFASTNTYFGGWSYGAFMQDDLRLRPNLTLNLGLRYEYYTPMEEKYGRLANLDIAPGFTGVAVVTPDKPGPYTGAFPPGLVEPDRNNLAPRVALAWRPFPKRRTLVRTGYGIFFNGSIYNQFAARLAAQPPFAPATGTVNTSLARVLTLDNGFGSSPSAQITNTFAVDRGYRVGYAQTWSFAVQNELPGGLSLELGYLGTKGTRLDIQRMPNRAAPGSPLTAEQRRQIGNAVGFTYESSEGNSIYHAAQVRITRRFRRGVSANALYTFSKSIDNASTFGGAGNTVAQDDRNLAAERGLSSFDQRHNLNLFYMISSPTGRSGSVMRGGGVLARLLEGWNLSGGITVRSGTPFTARVLGNLSDSGGTGSVGSGRADSTGQPVASGTGFFNLAAFTVPPATRYGNAGRNTIPGLSQFSMNSSLARSFRLGEDRRRLEFRLDVSNPINHVTYTGIGTVVNASNYGLATSAGPMRSMTATMRYRF